MVWWPFATKPERADTSEVTDLHSGAPPLYSTTFVVKMSVSILAAAKSQLRPLRFALCALFERAL